jgi:hypothetical protein
MIDLIIRNEVAILGGDSKKVFLTGMMEGVAIALATWLRF